VGEAAFDLWDELMEVLGRPRWMARGACAGVATGVFYPGRGGADEAAAAKAVCGGCGVRAECLRYALDHRQRDGVWGGTTEKERRAMLRDWRAGRAAVAPPLPEVVATDWAPVVARLRPFGHPLPSRRGTLVLQPRRAS
jgi:WhiB family redox-sensing transcriptional regulator